MPAAMGCTTSSPSFQSCGFSGTRFFDFFCRELLNWEEKRGLDCFAVLFVLAIGSCLGVEFGAPRPGREWFESLSNGVLP
jgi:hypothetical protein